MIFPFKEFIKGNPQWWKFPINGESTVCPPFCDDSIWVHKCEIGLEAYLSFVHVDATAHDFEGAPSPVVFERVVPENVHVSSVRSAGQTCFHWVHYPVYSWTLLTSAKNKPDFERRFIVGIIDFCKHVSFSMSPIPSIKIKIIYFSFCIFVY